MKKEVNILISGDKIFNTICIYITIFIFIGCNNGKKYKYATSILEAKENGNFIKEYSVSNYGVNMPFSVEEAWIEKVWHRNSKTDDDYRLSVFMKLQLNDIMYNNDQRFKYKVIIGDTLTKFFLNDVPHSNFHYKYDKYNEIQCKLGWVINEKEITTYPNKLQFNVIYDANRDSILGKITLYLGTSPTD